MTTTETYVHKSEKLLQIGKDSGWNSKLVPDISDPLNIVWTLFFSRKPEVMKVVYVSNRMTEAIYKVGDKSTNPPHKAAVVKILTGHPDLTRLDGETVMAHRKLPFDPQDIMPSRILESLLGKRIAWLNSYSTELDTEKIEIHRNKNSRWFRIIRTSDGRRYVEFTSDHGFRAVYLRRNRIGEVMSGPAPSTKRKAFERDGWQDEHGNWFAMCSFGCGDVLVPKTATLDHYPIMKQHGGTYRLDNVRLACAPCNSRNRNHKKDKTKRAKKKRDNIARNAPDTEKEQFRSKTYPASVKAKLKENYPSAEGRDVNGIIRMDF